MQEGKGREGKGWDHNRKPASALRKYMRSPAKKSFQKSVSQDWSLTKKDLVLYDIQSSTGVFLYTYISQKYSIQLSLFMQEKLPFSDKSQTSPQFIFIESKSVVRAIMM